MKPRRPVTAGLAPPRVNDGIKAREETGSPQANPEVTERLGVRRGQLQEQGRDGHVSLQTLDFRIVSTGQRDPIFGLT